MKKFLQTLTLGAAALIAAPAAMGAGNMYLIGAPQGWDINNGNMPLTETSSGIFEAYYEINPADFMFRFYTELGDWESNSIGVQVADDPVIITMTDDTWYTGNYVAGKGSWSNPMWNGGGLYITVNTNNQTVVFTTNPNADIPTPMPPFYIKGANINGSTDWDGRTTMDFDYTINAYVWEGTQLGSGFKFTDVPGWDGQYNIGSNGSPLQVGVPYVYYNGGDSGNITFSSDSEVINNPRVVLDLNAGTVTVTGNQQTQETSLTLAGTFNDWVSNDPDYKLNLSSNGLYEGKFYMFPGSSFQVVLLGSTWYGYSSGDGNISIGEQPVTLGLGKGYQNDFILSDWQGGDLIFSVNLQAMTLTISNPATGINGIEADNASKTVYNLQGVKVNSDILAPGLYIINGKKVMVK